MKKIEKQIEHYASLSVPNVLDDVLHQKGPMRHYKKPRFVFKYVTMALLIPVIAFIFIILSPSEDLAASTLTLDFETSIALEMNEDDEVLKIIGINESGRLLADLIENELAYKNQDITELLTLIYALAIENNLMSEETTVLYSVESRNINAQEALAAKMEDHFKNLPENARPFKDVYKTDVNDEPDDELGDNQDISIPRMQAIRGILNNSDDYTFQDLRNLSNEAIVQIYIDLGLEIKDNTVPPNRP
jgi:hypothetical protein